MSWPAWRRKDRKFLAGMMGKKPVWVDIESSGLVLSPAGGGKTVSFVVPALMHNPMSMIVTDLKGTLAAITAKHRAKKMGHEAFILNPGAVFADILGPGAKYNPAGILLKNWADKARHRFLMSDAQMLSRKLLPEPVKAGENGFFRKASRKLIVFALVYQATLTGEVTFSGTLDLLSDMKALEAAIYIAAGSDVLRGDLARLAKDLQSKLAGDKRDQFESFREGATQVLEPYSPSGVLAEVTSASDFSFADLRDEAATVYIVCDPTQADVFAPWLEMVLESAKVELIRKPQSGKRGKVCYLIDEATNFHYESLPSMMTAGREFGLIHWVVVQELEQFAHRYGREALDVLLSQTEVKIVHGSRSQKTCQLISDMIGETTVESKSYNMGSGWFDRMTSSVSEASRKILTPDEVARFEQVILFTDKAPPLAIDQVGYHEVHHWWKQAAPNPLFGTKRYKGKIKLRL